jgi:hypothetical protein
MREEMREWEWEEMKGNEIYRFFSWVTLAETR